MGSHRPAGTDGVRPSHRLRIRTSRSRSRAFFTGSSRAASQRARCN